MMKRPNQIRKEFTRFRRYTCLLKGAIFGAVITITLQNFTGHYVSVNFLPSSIYVTEKALND